MSHPRTLTSMMAFIFLAAISTLTPAIASDKANGERKPDKAERVEPDRDKDKSDRTDRSRFNEKGERIPSRNNPWDGRPMVPGGPKY